MNYTLEKLKDVAEARCFDGIEYNKLVEDAEETLNKGLNTDKNINRLQILCAVAVRGRDTSCFDHVFEIAQGFKNSLSDKKAIATYEHSMMTLYFRLGFAPKIIDHGLNALEADEDNIRLGLSVYSILGIYAKEYGMYDRTLEYIEKVTELSKKQTQIDPFTYELINEENTCTVLAAAGRREELKIHMDRLADCIEKNADNPSVKGMSKTIPISMLYYRAVIEGYNDELIEQYIHAVDKIFSTEKEKGGIMSTMDNHVEFLKHMTEGKYADDCIRICTGLLLGDVYIDTNNRDVYRILLKTLKNKPNALDVKTSSEFLSRYIDILEGDFDRQHEVFAHLINEEYRIREVNTQYDRLKVKYETDLLTVCYNRPSFEMNAADFVKEYPDGSIVFMDIDNLKSVNDAFGHAAGDCLLKSYVNIALGVIDKEKDRLYRYAGDEFILLTSRSAQEAEKLVGQMTEAYKIPIASDGHEIHIEFSHGIVAFCEVPDLAHGSEKLDEGIRTAVSMADARMYECKKTHKNVRK